MKNIIPSDLLHQPIETLCLSRELTSILEMHGFFTLSDVIKRRTVELEKLPGFSLRLVYEYVSFMEDRGLGHCIDPY